MCRGLPIRVTETHFENLEIQVNPQLSASVTPAGSHLRSSSNNNNTYGRARAREARARARSARARREEIVKRSLRRSIP